MPAGRGGRRSFFSAPVDELFAGWLGLSFAGSAACDCDGAGAPAPAAGNLMLKSGGFEPGRPSPNL